MAKDDSKIKSITELRDHALMAIERLSNGEIDTATAAATGKLCDSVIHTIKTQLEYSRMVGIEPEIPFMLTQVKGNLIEHDNKKPNLALDHKRR
jgi:hypothetical protein